MTGIARTRVLAPAAAAATAVVLGCGGAGDGGGASAQPSRTEAPVETAATPAATARTSARRGLRLARIGTFAEPVYLTSPPGGRGSQFVVERAGRIVVVRHGRKRSTPFLDIRAQVASGGQEQGLLSMAFAPDYASSGLFYVYFTGRDQNQHVVEYKRESADRADPRSARPVLTMADSEANHNGGLLLFGPGDLLYIGTGDGGGAGDRHGAHGNAQNLGSLLGKILRIDPRRSGSRRYTVPRSNPFVDRRGARGEIYSYGLRNPWRFSFDPRTHDLSIGDVGQNAVEEIDSVGSGRGKNFGWRVFEGRGRYTRGETARGAVRPVIQRLHSKGNCSITGGVVVRDPNLLSLKGRYVFGDFCRGRIESARLSPGRARDVRQTRLSVPSLSSFGVDALGRVYALSLGGPVYRLAPRR